MASSQHCKGPMLQLPEDEPCCPASCNTAVSACLCTMVVTTRIRTHSSHRNTVATDSGQSRCESGSPAHPSFPHDLVISAVLDSCHPLAGSFSSISSSLPLLHHSPEPLLGHHIDWPGLQLAVLHHKTQIANEFSAQYSGCT